MLLAVTPYRMETSTVEWRPRQRPPPWPTELLPPVRRSRKMKNIRSDLSTTAFALPRVLFARPFLLGLLCPLPPTISCTKSMHPRRQVPPVRGEGARLPPIRGTRIGRAQPRSCPPRRGPLLGAPDGGERRERQGRDERHTGLRACRQHHLQGEFVAQKGGQAGRASRARGLNSCAPTIWFGGVSLCCFCLSELRNIGKYVYFRDV